MFRLMRVYEQAGAGDGRRVLVERLWPRGMSRKSLRLDAWLRDVAPSTDLRRWFAHDPSRWSEFRRRYFLELDARSEAWRELLAQGRRRRVTLLFSSHDLQHNNAVALRDYLEAKLRSRSASRARGAARGAGAASRHAGGGRPARRAASAPGSRAARRRPAGRHASGQARSRLAGRGPA